MFDSIGISNSSSSSYSNSVKINAVTGNILKNYRDSFFIKLNLNSEMAEMIFDRGVIRLKTKEEVRTEYYRTGEIDTWKTGKYVYGDEIPIVVLQMMMCGDMEVIAEIITKEDFDKTFEPVRAY